MLRTILTLSSQAASPARGRVKSLGPSSIKRLSSRSLGSSSERGSEADLRPGGRQIYRQIKTNCAASKKALSHSRIVESNEEAWGSSGARAEIDVELNDLELSLSGDGGQADDGPLTFNLTWLRDSCQCAKCTHQYSRQRLFTPKHFRRHLFQVKEVSLAEGRAARGQICWPRFSSGENEEEKELLLRVDWADGHKSEYSLEWLKRVAASCRERGPRRFALPADDFYAARETQTDAGPVCWTAQEIGQLLEPIEYRHLTDGFDFQRFANPTFINANKLHELSARRLEALFSLARQLVRYGLAKVVNVPREAGQVLKVARSIAYERPTGYGTVFDVVVEPSEQINLAYSTQEFDLHTDLPYRETSPGVQLLHCIENSTVGGLSYFSDAFKAARMLRESSEPLYDILLSLPATFVVHDPYRDIKFRRQCTILAHDFRGNLSQVHYSPFVLPPLGHVREVKLFYLALDTFTKLLQSQENKLVAKMQPGDLFIFNNRRVLHGRSAYDAKSSRFLQGCYMDLDEIECLHEKLHPSNRR